MTARHVFQADPSVPADPYSGLRVCGFPGCGLPEANKAHELPERDEPDARQLAAGDEEASG